MKKIRRSITNLSNTVYGSYERLQRKIIKHRVRRMRRKTGLVFNSCNLSLYGM